MVQFVSCLRRVFCKTRLIFPRINSLNVPEHANHENQHFRERMLFLRVDDDTAKGRINRNFISDEKVLGD